MALAVRASSSAKVLSTRRVQPRAARAVARPVAALNTKFAAGVASVATAAIVAAAPAEAHNVVMSLAAEPYPAAWLSTALVPLTGLLFPAISMASLFLYITKVKTE